MNGIVAVDMTGAGDEFAGALAGRLALDDLLTAAAKTATQSAARTVSLARTPR